MKNAVIILLLFLVNVNLYSQDKFLLVRDIITNEPIANLEVVLGNSTLLTDKEGKLSLEHFSSINKISVENGVVINEGLNTEEITIFNIEGKVVKDFVLPGFNESHSISDLPFGWYYLKTKYTNLKFLNHAGRFQSTFESINKILISSDEYEEVEITLKDIKDQKTIFLVKKNIELNTLLNLQSKFHFNLLKSKPFSQSFSGVESVKLLYNLDEDLLHYFNTKLFLVHYDFASKVLNYLSDKAYFSRVEYTINEDRKYLPATLDYYKSSDIYVLDISAFTEVTCDDVKRIYEKIISTSFISRNKFFIKEIKQLSFCNDLNFINVNQLNNGQVYQPLVMKESYGYLRKVEIKDLKNITYNSRDIMLLNDVPIDIGVCAGIISNTFQTPLTHINVLSHNRGTPNMAYKGSFYSLTFAKYIDKPIYLKVMLDTFIIREVDENELLQYFDLKPIKRKISLALDTITQGLVNLKMMSAKDVYTIGGKAANFAEILKIKLEDGSTIPIPEYYTSIPFYYYNQHIQTNRINEKIYDLLNNKSISGDPVQRYKYLDDIRKSIIYAKVSNDLVSLVKNHILVSNKSINFRFRSSTNAEDIEGFNGAGLYDSYSGNLTDKDIELTIKKVWASLWNNRAYDEREYFGINHNAVAMGILIHRSFTTELANGVVLTHNPFNQFNSAILINTHPDEYSVVRPDTKLVPEQVLYYDYKIKDEAYEYLSYSDHPSYNNKKILSETHLKTIQKYSLAIKNHYCKLSSTGCKTMDIEFKLDEVQGVEKIYIKQARYY